MARIDDIELANRRNGGVEVWLFWRRESNSDELTLSVADERTGEAFELSVARERALDAFYHPFAYHAAAA